MPTFIAVSDQIIARLIRAATRSLIYVAPGVNESVAAALGERLREVGTLSVKIVLDIDPEVCRLGYGDIKALEALHNLASRNLLALHFQPGIRVGLLVSDDQAIIFSPAPRLIEAGSNTDDKPNGVVLGESVASLIERSVGADSSDVLPSMAEIGRGVVTPEIVQTVRDDLTKVPPAKFDLARRTRIFSSRLQFVELEATGLRFTQRQLQLPQDLLQADAQDDLAGQLKTNFRLPASVSAQVVELWLKDSGEPLTKEERKGSEIKSQKWTAQRLNDEIARVRHDYLRSIPGYGTVLEIVYRDEFEKRVKCLANVAKAFKAEFVEAYRVSLQPEAQRLTALVLQRLRDKRPASMRPVDYPGGIGVQHVQTFVEANILEALERSISIDGDVTLAYKNIAPESLADQRFQDALKKVPEPHRSTLFRFFDAAEAH